MRTKRTELMQMNNKKLFEEQYGKGKLKVEVTFPVLRELLKNNDRSRYDIVDELLGSFYGGGGSLLDIGCGDGNLIFRLQKRFEECHGVDISPTRIMKAKEATKRLYHEDDKFSFIEHDLNQKINFFKDDRFDVITCIATLPNVYDIFLIIDESYRLLKDTGFFVVEVPNLGYIRNRVKLLLGILPVSAAVDIKTWPEVGWDAGILHYFTMSSLCFLLKQRGFDIIKKSGSGLLASLRNWYPSLLTGDLIVVARK